ncbi:MAG: acyltransferase [Undibacterium sp.]|nr:acyltransferase [Undibacterium sp.]
MNKFVFANQLRGVAALLVLASHWFGVFWGMREPVAEYIAAPVMEGVSSRVYDWVSWFSPTLQLGPLGVAIFFLISGFVIPLSLEKMRVREFLIARFFRIFPTYWVCLSIGILVVFFSSRYWGKAIFWNEKTLLTNLFFVNELFGETSIDMVNWTLSIELKFYLLVALLAAGLRQGKVFGIFVYSILALLFNWNLPHINALINVPSVSVALQGLSTQLFYIQLMFVGSFFSFAVQGKMSNPKLLICSLTQLGIFGLTWQHSLLAAQFPDVTLNYIFGFCLFACAYIFRHQFKANRVLDFLADLSFPLYLMHALTGYVLITVLLHLGLYYPLVILLASSVVGVLTYGMHRFVELPSNRFGKRLS